MRKNRALIWILAFLPLALVAFTYARLPEQIPTNWGIDGVVQGYGPKWNLLIIAGLSPLVALLYTAMPRLDPKRRNYEKFSRQYNGFICVFLLLLFGFTAMIVSESLSPGKISIGKTIMAVFGLFFVYLGNIMPKFKRNYFMGIKTPWTLASDEVWIGTHRMAGYMWFAGGIAILIISLLLPMRELFAAFFAVMMFITIVPTIYSFLLYRKLGLMDTQSDEKN